MAEAPKILVVDDEQTNRIVLEGMMTALGYRVVAAEHGLSAIAMVGRENPDVILLDIMMPEMDGYQVLEYLSADVAYRDIPIIMISALDDMSSVVRCIEAGADDYLAKPFDPILLRARVQASVERKKLRDREADYRLQIEDYNMRLETRVREQVREITRAQMATIFAMSKLAESRDDDTGVHLERMREYCRIVARRLGGFPRYAGLVTESYLYNLHAASPLHDIGKVGVPDAILLKPGRLDTDEFTIMKGHTRIGADMLRAVDAEHAGNQFIVMGIQIALSHHEKWDGSGYPQGSAGEDIPLPARILALGDVYDALTSKRCYKDASPHEKSRDIILEGRGAHFDPDVVDAFFLAEDEFVATRDRLQDTPT